MTSQHDFPYTYEGAIQVLKRLTGPDGCPWDREQTPESLKPQLVEECYEVVDAIESGEPEKIAEELGDVLFNLLFQVHLGERDGRFDEHDVYRLLIDKLVRRHSHVFGDVEVSGAEGAKDNWQAIKQKEREASAQSVLDGVPRQMPALSYSQAVQERASRVGFDWENVQGVLAKVSEELAEIEQATSQAEREAEVGDLLFSVVNAARWMGIDAEGALRQANRRFYDRFTGMEVMSRERALDFKQLSLDEKEALWQESKARIAEQSK
jgi:tetrapyrrole methylase family protein/MazG family protein